jgi:hypothetical protein
MIHIHYTATFLNPPGEMMEEFHFIDMAVRTWNNNHTWYRRNNITNFSWLDFILTNLPMSNPTYFTKISLFDHAWVQTSFGQKKGEYCTHPIMKDYVLGCDEFRHNTMRAILKHHNWCKLRFIWCFLLPIKIRPCLDFKESFLAPLLWFCRPFFKINQNRF